MSAMRFKETMIGLIPEEWQVRTIDEIKANQPYALAMGPFGSNITTNNFIPSGIPIIRGVNLSNYKFKNSAFVYISEAKADELKSSNAFPDDIVVTHRGTLGQIGIIPENGVYTRYVVSQSQMKLTCNKKIANPEFIFYYLKSPAGQHQLLINTSTTGVPAIAQPLTSLRKIIVPLPSPQEQTAIAMFLKSIDDKIELSHELNVELALYVQLVFKHWFVDFEFPNKEGKPYKSSGGQMVLNEIVGKPIPKGWQVGEINDLCSSITNGGTPKRMEGSYWNGSISWFKTGELTDGPLIDSEEYITEEGLSNSAAHLWNENTILIALYASPTVGRLGLLRTKAASNQACSGLVAKEEIGYSFLFYTLFFKRNEFNNIAVGACQQNISQQIVREAKTVIPPVALLQSFSCIADAFFEKQSAIVIQNRTLSKIRDELLPKLMSGKIRVPLTNENVVVN